MYVLQIKLFKYIFVIIHLHEFLGLGCSNYRNTWNSSKILFEVERMAFDKHL